MADSKMDDDSQNDEDILEGYRSIQEYSTSLFKSLVGATKAANGLSSSRDDFEFWSSFTDFSDFCDSQGKRILNVVGSLVAHQSIDCNWWRHSVQDDIDERFDALVDANDVMLEQIGVQIDEIAGLSKNKKPILPSSIQQSKPIVSSWNMKKGDKSMNFHLLLAKNIHRPQLNWQDTVDNSNMPFMSPIQHKPNALRPLVKARAINNDQPSDSASSFIESQRIDTSSDLFEPCHPYKYEIEMLQLNDWQLEEVEEIKYKSLEETSLTMVKDSKSLQDMLEVLKKSKEIAVDLENHSYRSFLGFVCLMQVSTREQDFIVDTLELRREMHILNEVFTDPAILKVFHGADMDIEWLQRDFGLYIVNMFDTGQASRSLQFPRFSLSFLLSKYCGISADKKYQLADWRIRPIPTEMMKYAREDTHYLLYVYDMLRNELIKTAKSSLSMLKSVYESSKHITLKIYAKSRFYPDSYIRMYQKYRRRLNPQQVKCFELLYQWRDNLARQEDESTGYILPNHMMFQMSEILPKTPQGVLACCNPVPPLVKQNHNEIHRLVVQAKVYRPSFADDTVDNRTGNQDASSGGNAVKGATNSKTRETTLKANGIVVPEKTGFDLFPTTGPALRCVGASLSVFSASSLMRQKLSLADGLKQVEAIRSNMKSPFELLLPAVKTDAADPEQINEKWKLMSEKEAEHVTKATPSNPSGGLPAHQSVKRKVQETEESDIADKDEVASIRSKKGKIAEEKEVLTYERAVKNPTDFVSFDYSSNDLSSFATSSKSVDPVAEAMQASKQQRQKNPSRKSRVHSKFGNRSMTFKKP